MTSHTIDFLEKALIPVAVFGAFALLLRYVPAVSAENSGAHTLDELDHRFQNTKWVFNSMMVGVGSCFVWGSHALLVWLNSYFAAVEGPAIFRQFPQSATWWFLPGFGALALSYEMTLQLWSLLGKRNNADLYSEWSNRKTAKQWGKGNGIDCRKALRWLSIVVVLPIGILTVLELNVHVSIGQDSIRDCGYAFVPCKTCPYAEARRMTVIEGFRDKDGKLTWRAGVVLDFSNGSRWSSADTGDFQTTVDPALITFLQRKTGLPINYADTAAEIPLPVADR